MFKGSITALITPFKKETGSIDFEAFEKLIEIQINGGSDAIVIGGTTGEAPTLEKDEFQELIRFGIKLTNKRIPVLVGTGTYSTKKTCEATLFAKEAGADGALVIVPYYNKPTNEGVILHYQEIAKLGLPLIVYHHPGRTGVNLSCDTLVTLANIEGVVGIKESTGGVTLTKEILEKRPGTAIFSANDSIGLEMMEAGGVGIISVIGNLIPRAWRDLIALCENKKWSEAKAFYQELEPLVRAIELEPNPIGIKCALSLEGLCENVLRLPLTSATSSAQEVIRNQIEMRISSLVR